MLKAFIKINNIAEYKEEFSKDSYLILTNAHKAPPHISLSVEGKIYSLTVKGPSIESYDLFLKMVRQKKIPTLFFKLTEFEKAEKNISDYFFKYKKVQTGAVTCLYPIRDFFYEFYNIAPESVNFVFDLLDILYNRNLICSVQHLNMESFLKENAYDLPHYSLDIINKEITRLNSAIEC